MALGTRERLGPGLIRSDAYEEAARSQRGDQSLERGSVRDGVLENVLERKVVTNDVIRARRLRLYDCPGSQEPNTNVRIVCALLRFAQRRLVRVNRKDVGLNRFPLVNVSAASAPTIENLGSRPDPLGDEFALGPIVKLTKRVHFA